MDTTTKAVQQLADDIGKGRISRANTAAATLRALAQERDAARFEAAHYHKLTDNLGRAVAALEAERDAARAEVGRLREALKWTGEVYPETRSESGGAVVHMTWDEFNRMRELIGLPRRRPRPARTALAATEGKQ